ncbi:sulfatase-like hydrolase/transferase [Lactococcus fujiensis]|nr:sulfatase-like hydrolase/transferase [Lactococcus fujiensis]
MKFLSTAKLTLLLLIAGYSAVHLHSPLMFVRIIVEVFLILALTQILGHKFNSLPIRIIKYLLSSLLILFSLIDAIVATFSGTYLTVLMTQNLANIMDLGGNLWLYGSAALLVILAAFLPMRYNLFNKKQQLASIAIFGISLISLNLTATHQTPLFGYVGYFSSYNKMKEISNIKKPKSAQTKIEAEFAKSTIASGISTNLQQPNVIVIFTEGLSQEVLNYDGGKLTPNLNKLKNQTINFSNYYNQTAATYRGVRGQLFSEQQLNQGYENGQDQIKDALNTKLTSVQSILGDQGYQTEFINAEPNQSIWTTYVENLGFDKVTTDKSKSFLKLAGTTFMGDQQNYKFLFNQATELSKENNPFFLADYTFQTHLSLDSSLKYGDGKILT